MRIERVRVEGFGALSGVDLSWPEGKLLLVVDPNETGKSTFCEAIVSALYGLPRGRVGANRLRELRRPRSGARLSVGLDLVSEGVRWSVDRDLEAGTLRVFNRDRGLDQTRDFLRGGGRDVFGETVTGLQELLFRSTAYVAQNTLDGDRLDSTLTLELARIADSGGGEASVVRALRALQEVRAKMPDAASGSAVSVDTEIVRLTKSVELGRAESERLLGARRDAAAAADLLRHRREMSQASARRAELAGIAVLEAERRSLEERLIELRVGRERRTALEGEALDLEKESSLFSPEAIAEIERLRHELGTRPERLLAGKAALSEAAQNDERADAELVRRFGIIAAQPEEARRRLEALLEDIAENAAELSLATAAVEAQRLELQREGLAEDLDRLDPLSREDREFLAGAEEERRNFELEGIRLDRRAADAQAGAAIIVGERRERVKRAKALVGIAALLFPIALYLFLPSGHVPFPVASSLGVFDGVLALFGGIAWFRGSRHRRQDQESKREEEVVCRREAAKVRKKLSDHRLRLDRISKSAGFADGMALMKAHRRARAADDKRRAYIERCARRDAALARRIRLEEEIEPFRGAISCPSGLPSGDDARRQTQILEDVGRSRRVSENRAAQRAAESERLQQEGDELRVLERRLGEALARLGIPSSLPLQEAFVLMESGRKRATRRREIVDVELPARAPVRPEEEAELTQRIAALAEEKERRLTGHSARAGEVPAASTAEEARRVFELSRSAAEKAEAEVRAAEKTLASRVREGGDRAREVEEILFEASANLRRALLFRDAVDLARESLSSAASSAYGDFRRGLAEASRSILRSWDVPYEGLEFADDLAVTAVARGGRIASRNEIASALSTGAREQLHLTARLAAIRYLGTGDRGIPLLLDDPLVSADDDRFVSVMRFLAREVLAERPILVITCHAWRHERLIERLEPELKEKLAWVSLAAARSPAGEWGGSGQLRLV